MMFKRVICATLALLCICTTGISEEHTEAYNTLFVTATRLNGRFSPGKGSTITMMLDYGDDLEPTGQWSSKRGWVEVVGGENGTAWVSIQYVSEIFEPMTMTNATNGKVRIRKTPVDGKVVRWLKRGKSVTIDRVVLGWGHCKYGWIDMDCLE